MVADAASRRIGYKEEFVPSHIYDALIAFFGFYPTADGFATSANKKCEKYCARYAVFEKPNFVDFISLPPEDLQSEWWYLFPPRALLGETVKLIDKFKLSTILIFHIWQEIPPEVHVIYKRPNKIVKLDKSMRITLIPAERSIILDSKQLQGYFNHNIEKTFIILTNPKGPLSYKLLNEAFSFL